MKKFILDTNIFVSDPKCFLSFGKNTVVIPFVVLEELDHLKTKMDDAGKCARDAVRKIESLRGEGKLKDGIALSNGGSIVVSNEYDVDLDIDHSKNDNKIISLASLYLKRKEKVVVVSNDVNVRLKCDGLGIEAEAYENLKAFNNVSEAYTGILQVASINHVNKKELFPNQYVIDEENNIWKWKDKVLVKVDKKGIVFGIKPRNIEQYCALDALLDVDVPLVTISGRAGGGKTLLAIAAGLEQVIGGKQAYKKIIITRPMEPVGREIGYLPGSVQEKLSPWLSPIKDNLEFLMDSKKSGDAQPRDKKKLTITGTEAGAVASSNPYLELLMANGRIEMEAVSLIRGRTLPNTYIIIEESQNLTLHELKTIVTRVGEGSKIVLCGDLEQIDKPSLDSTTNGLAHAIEKFKDTDLAMHVTLQKGERSPLATYASQVL